MVYHSNEKTTAGTLEKWENIVREPAPARATRAKGGVMLVTRHRLSRDPYFHFHPLHTAFSLLTALILFGMLVWVLAVPAK